MAAGRIARAHGIGGRLRVRPSIDSPGETLPGKEVFVFNSPTPDPNHPDWRKYRIESASEVAGACLVKFVDLDDRTQAEALSGRFIFLGTAELPGLTADRFYVYRLCDMTAQTESGKRIGRIKDILDLPAQPVLVVESPDGDEVLVPFLRRFVRSVDEAEGRVIMAEIHELLELSESE
ncbi:ribosome maturation factor RimM [candidate division KSB1 bacterium]